MLCLLLDDWNVVSIFSTSSSQLERRMARRARSARCLNVFLMTRDATDAFVHANCCAIIFTGICEGRKRLTRTRFRSQMESE
jgi:hypothetical protein